MAAQNLVIATEGYFQIFAALFFGCAHLQAANFRHRAAQHRALTCTEDTNCIAESIPGIFSEGVSNCNLAIAIVSTVVFLSRLAMSRLDKTPYYIYILYDTLMGPIWILGFIQTIVANSNQSGPADIPSACALTACALVICMAAATVHFGRISTHVLSWLGYITSKDHLTDPEMAKDKAWFLEDGDGLSDQPLSPVLAFFR